MSDLHGFLIDNVFPKLSVRQVRYVMHRQKDVFGFGENTMTYRALAAQEGISVERARQIVLKGKRIIANRLHQISEAQKSPHVIIKKITEAELTPNLPMRQKFLSDLGELSVRTANCLTNEGLMIVDKLLEKTEAELLKIPNFGRKSRNEVIEVLACHNLKLKSPRQAAHDALAATNPNPNQEIDV